MRSSDVSPLPAQSVLPCCPPPSARRRLLQRHRSKNKHLDANKGFNYLIKGELYFCSSQLAPFALGCLSQQQAAVSATNTLIKCLFAARHVTFAISKPEEPERELLLSTFSSLSAASRLDSAVTPAAHLLMSPF